MFDSTHRDQSPCGSSVGESVRLWIGRWWFESAPRDQSQVTKHRGVAQPGRAAVSKTAPAQVRILPPLPIIWTFTVSSAQTVEVPPRLVDPTGVAVNLAPRRDEGHVRFAPCATKVARRRNMSRRARKPIICVTDRTPHLRTPPNCDVRYR